MLKSIIVIKDKTILCQWMFIKLNSKYFININNRFSKPEQTLLIEEILYHIEKKNSSWYICVTLETSCAILAVFGVGRKFAYIRQSDSETVHFSLSPPCRGPTVSPVPRHSHAGELRIFSSFSIIKMII